MRNFVLKLSILVVLLVPCFVQANYVPEIYTKTNFKTSFQDTPVSFIRDSLGNFSGITKTGKTFTQTYITTSISVRLQKFAIDSASHYISDQGVIEASSDLEALSVYLSILDLNVYDFNEV